VPEPTGTGAFGRTSDGQWQGVLPLAGASTGAPITLNGMAISPIGVVTGLQGLAVNGALTLTGGTFWTSMPIWTTGIRPTALPGNFPIQGNVILDADPTVPLGAATKQYVDDEVAAVPRGLPLTGGTLTGTLNGTNGLFSSMLRAVEMRADMLANNAGNGPPAVTWPPTLPGHVATKAYVDNAIAAAIAAAFAARGL